MQNFRLLACAVFALAGVSRASTYVVDAANGPGTNFTDIPPAIFAAVAGDTIVVRPGHYSGFTLSEGLTIVGQPGANIAPDVTISGLPAGEVAVLSRLKLRRTSVVNCQGAVVIDHTTIKAANPYYRTFMVDVVACLDVRFHQCLIEGSNGANNVASLHGGTAMSIESSRIEFSGCDVYGGNGANTSNCTSAGYGGRGLFCFNSSRLHFAHSSAHGGTGGTASGFCGPPDGGGGTAISVDGSQAIIAGVASDIVEGGLAGGFTNYDGYGVSVSYGTLRYSGTTVQSISTCIQCSAATVHATPDDPTLEVIGDPLPGATITYRLYGIPGHKARLQEGDQPLLQKDGLAPIEELVSRKRVYPPVTIPASGQVDFVTTIPTKWLAGTARLVQGFELDATTNALLARTNSVDTIVHN